MKPHKHADYIKAFADGENVQCYDSINDVWFQIKKLVEFDLHECSLFRIKPREFIEGRWYPCRSDVCDEILLYTKKGFCRTSTSDSFDGPECFEWIGEPLPEIEWPEGL